MFDSALSVSDSALCWILHCLCWILHCLCDSVLTVSDSALSVSDSALTVSDSVLTVSDSALSVSDSVLTVSDSVLSCCQKSHETAAQSEGPHLMRMSRKVAVPGQLQPQTPAPCDSSRDRDLWRTGLKSHFPPMTQSANVIARQATSPPPSAA